MKKDVWGEKFKGESKNDTFKFTSIFGWMPFSKESFDVVTKYITKNDLNILEAGCGSGRMCIGLAEKFPDSKIIGVDISKFTLDIAKKGAQLRKLKNVTFKSANIFRLPFKDDSFDVVFNVGVIEHFEDYEKIVKEMKRIVKKNGKIIIAVPNKLNLFHFTCNYLDQKVLKTRRYGLERVFSPKELTQLFYYCKLKNLNQDGYGVFYRMSKFIHSKNIILQVLQKIFKGIAIMLHYLIAIPLDFIFRHRFSKYFGWEVVVAGEK